jgi:hypothetical protein
MKKLLTIANTLMLGAALLGGCTKSSTSGTNYTMSATVAGAAFSGGTLCTLSGTTLSVWGSKTFTASTPSYPYINFIVSNYTGNGTYTIAPLGTNVASYIASMTSASQVSYGTITITATSPITGTFNFTCTDSTKITGGNFTAKAN